MPGESKLTIAQRDVGDVTVLTLTGQILLDDGDLAIGGAVHELVDRGRVKLLVNMGGVSYTDSAGVGMLAGQLKNVRSHGGDMKLVNLNSRGQRLFGMMKLHLAFEILDNEEMAIKSFAFKA
jgi:anti-sigma B factor antagonist